MVVVIVIISIVGLILGAGLMYLILKPQIEVKATIEKRIVSENETIQQENKILVEEKLHLSQERDKIKEEYIQLQAQKQSLNNQNNEVVDQINKLNQSLSQLQQQAKTAADDYYKSNMQIAQEHFEKDLEYEAQQHQLNVSNFLLEYNDTVASLMAEMSNLSSNIVQLKATNEAAIEAAKRAEELREKQDFYRLKLSHEDIKEISLLREIEPKLRNTEPLNKVIWKCYYEKPTADLIGRVIGQGAKTGIYRITDIESGRCYIGQATSLSDRFRQHIKRGIGAETPTRNKLYPAMRELGPENFTFEIVEECSKAQLDEREDYWQDYFQAKTWGYSIK